MMEIERPKFLRGLVAYRLNAINDHEKDKRSHVSLNTLVMIDNDASNMTLDNTAKRRKRNDTKQPIIESTLSRFMSHWKSSYEEYVESQTNYSNKEVKIMMVGSYFFCLSAITARAGSCRAGESFLPILLTQLKLSARWASKNCAKAIFRCVVRADFSSPLCNENAVNFLNAMGQCVQTHGPRQSVTLNSRAAMPKVQKRKPFLLKSNRTPRYIPT